MTQWLHEVYEGLKGKGLLNMTEPQAAATAAIRTPGGGGGGGGGGYSTCISSTTSLSSHKRY